METEVNPNVALKPPPLNSDQLNYLIWRYLQEAGYGEAAVKLQRDWKVEPETLPFAKHIKGQALVSLVQKGLRYHHLSLTIDKNGRKQLEPSTLFFGPESGRLSNSGSSREPLYSSTEARRHSSLSPNTPNIPRKRETESNGPLDPNSNSNKRSRKTVQITTNDRNGNGVRKVSASLGDAPMPMDIDVNGHVGSMRNMRSPSASENLHDDAAINGIDAEGHMDIDIEEQGPDPSKYDQMQHEISEPITPLIPTLTNGESIGVQVTPAKIANLGPSTTILTLPDNLHLAKSVWRPSDGSLLTVAGDNFCGVWKSTNSNGLDDTSKMVYQDLLGPDNLSMVTAVAWEPDGKFLAIATYSGHAGQLHLFHGQELMLIENLPASQRAILSLKWLPSAFKLIGIAPWEDQGPGQGRSSTILLWDFSGMQFSTSPLTLTVPELLVDVDSASYAGHGVICTAGGHAVYYCRASNELGVEKKWSFDTDIGTNWAFVRFVWQNDAPVIIVASSENARIWLPTKDIVQNDAHAAPITAMELRRRAFQDSATNSIPDFATSSMDGTIKVWHFDSQTSSIEIMHRLMIDQQVPIKSLSFSPDGFCLAGVSFGAARIWNAEHEYNEMASWEGRSEEWRGTSLKDEDTSSAGGHSSVNGDSGSADHSLAWDADSKKLAFSLASQVAIIDFQR